MVGFVYSGVDELVPDLSFEGRVVVLIEFLVCVVAFAIFLLHEEHNLDGFGCVSMY